MPTNRDVENIDPEGNSQSEMEPERLTHGGSTSFVAYTSILGFALTLAVVSVLVYKYRMIKGRLKQTLQIG